MQRSPKAMLLRAHKCLSSGMRLSPPTHGIGWQAVTPGALSNHDPKIVMCWFAFSSSISKKQLCDLTVDYVHVPRQP